MDSFGTEPEYNYAEYNGLPEELRSSWGKANVHPRQIMTMFRKTQSHLSCYINQVIGTALEIMTQSNSIYM